MALVEQREELEGGNVQIRLPGVQKGDMASRNFKPEVKVFSVRFSPTGQSWAAACTEGLLIYSLDKGEKASGNITYLQILLIIIVLFTSYLNILTF